MVDGNKLKHGELLLHDINNERGNQKREGKAYFYSHKVSYQQDAKHIYPRASHIKGQSCKNRFQGKEIHPIILPYFESNPI